VSIASDSVVGFRTRWATRFVDAGTLNRETGIGTFNGTTGQYDTPSSSQIFSGACLIRPKARTTSDFAETETDVESYDIFVPHSAIGAKPGDKFTVGFLYNFDPGLLGAVLVLTEVIEDSYLTKYQWVATRIKS